MHDIVIKNVGRLTFSRKTSTNVLKMDAWKSGIKGGKLKKFGNCP